ncbi:hypothetical protein ACFBZI_11045 [Moraxella sp. ZJ142]|uniref:hypothetical protein n=1 Tax=Moraxella marmotae TaxID=3344520 RepID=UPI0035D4EE3A
MTNLYEITLFLKAANRVFHHLGESATLAHLVKNAPTIEDPNSELASFGMTANQYAERVHDEIVELLFSDLLVAVQKASELLKDTEHLAKFIKDGPVIENTDENVGLVRNGEDGADSSKFTLNDLAADVYTALSDIPEFPKDVVAPFAEDFTQQGGKS